ncbi:hypothetical protein Dimus_000179, partial [Dionaea muscipula]
MGLHGDHGRWRCRGERSSMEMSTAEKGESFDGDLHGREGLRWQSWEMEMSTAEKGFDG